MGTSSSARRTGFGPILPAPSTFGRRESKDWFLYTFFEFSVPILRLDSPLVSRSVALPVPLNRPPSLKSTLIVAGEFGFSRSSRQQAFCNLRPSWLKYVPKLECKPYIYRAP